MAIQRRNAACSIYIKGALTGDELFEKHGARHLAQYESQLRLMREAVENGEVPDGTDQSVRPYVEQLKRHLGIDDIAEHDDFLLRFALIVPGRMRGIRPPLVVLTPERGGFSHQRLEQAATQFTRLRMALHLGRCFDGNLSSDTYTALRELADRIEGLAEIDGGWVEIHENLSSIEADRLAQHAIACLDAPLKDEQELGIEVLNCLANFRHDGLKGRTADLLRRGIFWPASLYRDAPNNIAAALVQQIAKADGIKLNHLLLALAWTRGEPARRMFHEWRIQPPAWTASLHVPPEDYLPNAGWALDSNGGRREVISKSCHRIVPVPNVSMPDMAISCRVPLEKLCPGCGTRLGWLFDFSNLPVQFFASERATAPKRVLYCPNCSCYGPVFSQYHHDGKVELHPATESDQTSSIEPGPSCGRAIIVTEQPPFAAADPFGIPYATSLGGVPMWLQDAEYPNYPDCHKTMTFLAQFDHGSMPTPEEGIFYAFFCEGCRVAAVNYQQTWATVPLLRSQSHGERRR